MAGDAEAVVRAVIEAAKGGDMTAAKIILDRIAPPCRGRPVRLDLPPVSAADLVKALAAVADAMACGVLSAEEAQAAAAVLGTPSLRRVRVEQRFPADFHVPAQREHPCQSISQCGQRTEGARSILCRLQGCPRIYLLVADLLLHPARESTFAADLCSGCHELAVAVAVARGTDPTGEAEAGFDIHDLIAIGADVDHRSTRASRFFAECRDAVIGIA